MTARRHITVMAGGGEASAAASFVSILKEVLSDKFCVSAYEGAEALAHLYRCDALVLVGYHAPEVLDEHYVPLSRLAKQAFGAFVSSGKPLVVAPEGAASFPDWPRYGELLGYRAEFPRTTGDDEATVSIFAEPSSWCVALNAMELFWRDVAELIIDPRMEADVLASVQCPQRGTVPLIVSARGGPRPGAGI